MKWAWHIVVLHGFFLGLFFAHTVQATAVVANVRKNVPNNNRSSTKRSDHRLWWDSLHDETTLYSCFHFSRGTGMMKSLALVMHLRQPIQQKWFLVVTSCCCVLYRQKIFQSEALQRAGKFSKRG
jgi:hypothetical protein